MEQKYAAYFEGKLRDRHNKDYVYVALSTKLDFTDKKIKSLFAKKKVKIKGGLTKDEAIRVAKKFYSCGMILRISRTKDKPQKSKSQKKHLTTETIDQNDYQKIFVNKHPKTKPSLNYRTGLMLNLLLTLLLPLIYFSLVFMFVYVLYGYFTAVLSEILEVKNGFYFQIIFNVVLLFFSFLLLLLLLKPFFSSYRKCPKVLLKRSENADFFALIDGITNYVGCEKPIQIFIDSSAHASASFPSGFAGFFKRQMTLTLGMPLVNGMSSQQLAGVIAHEFGYFAQYGVTRISFLINSVNSWLYLRAYKDDLWDEKIETMREKTTVHFFYIVLALISFGIVLVRCVLKLLLSSSVKTTLYLSRKMEFNADSYEIAVSGSKVFKETSLQLRLLQIAQAEVEEINDYAYETSSRLLEDMPSAVVEVVRLFDKSIIEGVEAEMDEIHPRVCGSRPADNERIKHAESLKQKGVFLSNVPATTLFKNLAKLNRKVTFNYYDKYLNVRNPKKFIVENNEIKF